MINTFLVLMIWRVENIHFQTCFRRFVGGGWMRKRETGVSELRMIQFGWLGK